MNKTQKLKILFVEDSQDDVELAQEIELLKRMLEE